MSTEHAHVGSDGTNRSTDESSAHWESVWLTKSFDAVSWFESGPTG